MKDNEAPSTPRRRYAGSGVGELRATRRHTKVLLPSADAATLLPDPIASFNALLDKFGEANGIHLKTVVPSMETNDVNLFANFITYALRNDLPTIDPHDAAVIWEKWRRALRGLRPMTSWRAAGYIVDRGGETAYDLETALKTPRVVFNNYCPWRADWATPARVLPEGA